MSVDPNLNQPRSPPIATESPPSPLLPHLEYHAPDDDALEQQRPGDGDDEDEDEIPYPDPSSEQTLLAPPNFRPFFTLVEDATSGEHHHPYVHYVFADDEPSMMTAALMRGLGLDDTKYLPQDAHTQTEKQRSEGGSDGGDDSPVESPLPPPIPGVKERYMIIDLGADGRTIMDAQSLSPDWQITDRNVRTAPSFDESSPDQGFMLRIEGTEVPRNNKGKGKGQAGSDKLDEARENSQDDLFGALDALVGEIEVGLATAAKITGVQPTEEEDTVGDVRAAEVDADLTPGT